MGNVARSNQGHDSPAAALVHALTSDAGSRRLPAQEEAGVVMPVVENCRFTGVKKGIVINRGAVRSVVRGNLVRPLDPAAPEVYNQGQPQKEAMPQRPNRVVNRQSPESPTMNRREWIGSVAGALGAASLGPRPVHDQDEATHWVVRNHPDYKVHFHADCDRGERYFDERRRAKQLRKPKNKLQPIWCNPFWASIRDGTYHGLLDLHHDP